jgi:hypothetical protein
MATLASLCGCTVTVKVDSKLTSEPAIERLPLNVGVYYGESFHTDVHEHIETAFDDLWVISIGQSSVPILDSCFDAMFDSVTKLEAWSPGQAVPQTLNGVIAPRIEALDFTQRPFAATVAYGLTIYTHDQSVVTDIAQGHGENVLQPGTWSATPLNQARSAVEQAIRAASAEMVIQFPRDRGVRRWLRQCGVRSSGRSARAPRTATPPQDAIVVIPRAVSRESEGYASISHTVARRLEKKLRRAFRSRPLIDAEDWHDCVFPWFERSTMPRSDSEMVRFVNRPEVRRRIRELGVGHLILVRGSALDDEWEGPFIAGAGFGAAGALGITTRDEKAEVSAVIWDVASQRPTRLDAFDSGHSAVVGVILPIPFIDQVESKATNALADRIVDRLQDRKGVNQ